MSNFKFLKPVDKDLYDIISDAEKLYRDEYFEQCIAQTRRFGEVVCKNVLGDKRTTEKTFDDMLATLKDRCSTVVQEKEFIDDLYFLKREGNASVHSGSVKKDGIVALECVQRAFEVALNYAVFYKKSDSKLMKLRFDTELLVTGKKSAKTLAERYEEEKIKTKKSKKTTKKKQKKKIVYSEHKPKPWFWLFVGISAVVSVVLILTIYLLSLV